MSFRLKFVMSEISRSPLPVLGPFEVVVHNTPDDCWLSFLGKVFNVTPLIQQFKNDRCVRPLLAFAGKDVSHWFDARTGEIQHYVHPVTGALVPYCPHGRIPDVSFEAPTSLWRPLDGLPWWKNDVRYQVGVLTRRVRPLRVINTLICKEVALNVCCEDTFERIRDRFSIFNSDADSYTWTYNGKVVNMKKTMDENGICDDRDQLADLGIPKSCYTPCVFIYYNDDLKYCDDFSD